MFISSGLPSLLYKIALLFSIEICNDAYCYNYYTLSDLRITLLSIVLIITIHVGVWNYGRFDAKHIKDQNSQKAQSNDLKCLSRKYLAPCVEMVSENDILRSINHDDDEDLSSSHECEVNKNIKHEIEDTDLSDIFADSNNAHCCFDDDEDPEMGFEVINVKQHELTRLQTSSNSAPITRSDVMDDSLATSKAITHLHQIIAMFVFDPMRLIRLQQKASVEVKPLPQFCSNVVDGSIRLSPGNHRKGLPWCTREREYALILHKGREGEECYRVQTCYQLRNLEKVPLSSPQCLPTPCMEWRTSYSTKPHRKNYQKEFSYVPNGQDIPYTTYGGVGKTSGHASSSTSSSSTHTTQSHNVSHTSNTNNKSQTRKSSSGSSGDGDGDDPRSTKNAHLTLQNGSNKVEQTPTIPSKEANVQHEEHDGENMEAVGDSSGAEAESSTLMTSENLCAQCGELESNQVQENSESISNTSASSTPSHYIYSCEVEQEDNIGSSNKKGGRMMMQAIDTVPVLPAVFSEASHTSVEHQGFTKPKRKSRKCQKSRQKKMKSATPCQYCGTPTCICKTRIKGKVKQQCSQTSSGQQNVYSTASQGQMKEGSGKLGKEKSNSAEIHQQSLGTQHITQPCQQDGSLTEKSTLLDGQTEIDQVFSAGESKNHHSNERPNDYPLLIASEQKSEEEKNEMSSTPRPIIVHREKRDAENSRREVRAYPSLRRTRHQEKQAVNGKEKMKHNTPKENYKI